MTNGGLTKGCLQHHVLGVLASLLHGGQELGQGQSDVSGTGASVQGVVVVHQVLNRHLNNVQFVQQSNKLVLRFLFIRKLAFQAVTVLLCFVQQSPREVQVFEYLALSFLQTD